MNISTVTDCTHQDTLITRVGVSRAHTVMIDSELLTPVAYYTYSGTDGSPAHRVSMYGTDRRGEGARADLSAQDVPDEVREAVTERGVKL